MAFYPSPSTQRSRRASSPTLLPARRHRHHQGRGKRRERHPVLLPRRRRHRRRMPELMGSICGTRACGLIGLNHGRAGGRKRIVLGELAAAFGAETLEPEDIYLHTMMEDEWARCCSMLHPLPGMRTELEDCLRRPSGRVHWDGTEMAATYNWYMARRCVVREGAAKEVLLCSGCISSFPPFLNKINRFVRDWRQLECL